MHACTCTHAHTPAHTHTHGCISSFIWLGLYADAIMRQLLVHTSSLLHSPCFFSALHSRGKKNPFQHTPNADFQTFPAMIMSKTISWFITPPFYWNNSASVIYICFSKVKTLPWTFLSKALNNTVRMEENRVDAHGWTGPRLRGWRYRCCPRSHCRRPHHQTPARRSTGTRRLPPPQISSSVFHSWPAASPPETQRQRKGHTLFNI